MYVPGSGREAFTGTQLGAHGRTARCSTFPLERTTKAPQDVRITIRHGRPRGAVGSRLPQPPVWPAAAAGPIAVSPAARSTSAKRRTRWIRVAAPNRSPTTLRSMGSRIALLAGGSAAAVVCAGCTALRFLPPPTATTASAPSLAPPKHYSTRTSPESVVIADLDGDGKPDLAVGNGGDPTVSLLLNTGGGRFQDMYDQIAETGDRPVSVVAGDLTGDGAPELVTAKPRRGLGPRA